jgi:hypothetical protein
LGWRSLDRDRADYRAGSSIHAIIGYDDGNGTALHVIGDFTGMDGVPCNGFARWNGTSWTALPQIVNNFEGDCIVYDDGSGPALYATWRPAGSSRG